MLRRGGAGAANIKLWVSKTICLKDCKTKPCCEVVCVLAMQNAGKERGPGAQRVGMHTWPLGALSSSPAPNHYSFIL